MTVESVALRFGATGGVDFPELVFEVGFAFVGGGLEGGVGREQPAELNPFAQFRRRKL